MNLKLARQIVRLQRFVDRPWFLPAIAAVAALDLFVAVIPTEGILVSSVMLRPKRWLSMFLWVTTGSALGAVALTGAVRIWDDQIVTWLTGDEMLAAKWAKTAAFLDEYGAPALGAVAISPIPQQPAVVLCALAHMSMPAIFTAVWLGRGLKYGAFAWAATHAPHWFKKVGKSATREAKEIRAAK